MILHALLAEALAESYIRRAGRIWLPGYRNDLLAAAAEPEDDSLKLGDAAGIGTAYDDSAGELPQVAKESDHAQAFLGLDPPGVQSKQAAANGVQAAAAQPPAPSAASKSEQASPPAEHPPIEALAAASPFGVPGDGGGLVPGTLKSKAAKSAEPDQPPQNEASATSAEPAQQATQNASVAPPAGIPAEQAKTESDPVSTIVDARFRSGKTDIQSGRAHKITRPHLSLAAQADLLSIASPVLTLKITVDASGHVQNVAVFKSSGSGNIDEGCKLAAYDWWFEPAKDRNGAARGDVILFNIRFI